MPSKKRTKKKNQPDASKTSSAPPPDEELLDDIRKRLFPPSDAPPSKLNAEQFEFYKMYGNTNLSLIKYYDFNRLAERDETVILHDMRYPDGLKGEVALVEGVRKLLKDSLPPLPHRLYPSLFQISSIEGKGEGMVATRDIPRGETIVVEYPVVVIPTIYTKPTFEGGKSIHRMLFERLYENEQREFLKLYNCKPARVCGVEEGIIRTNGIAITLDIPKGRPEVEAIHSGIFFKISKCNHSCCPNATYDWNLTAFTLTLRSTRPIRVGEEITITYLSSLTAPREERRRKLKALYLFTCECPVCILPDEASAESYRNRVYLKEWWDKHMSWAQWVCQPELSDDELIKEHIRAIALAEKEGISDGYHAHVEAMALCYAALGDLKNFCLWALRVLGSAHAVVDTHIQKPERLELYGSWLAEPQSSGMWDARSLFKAGKISYWEAKNSRKKLSLHSSFHP